MIFVAASVASGFAEGVITHQPPTTAKSEEPLTLEAIVETADGGVVQVLVYHRIAGQSSYAEMEMSSLGNNLFFGTISAVDLTEDGLEYYITATLDDGSILAYPQTDPQNNPVLVTVLAGGEDFLNVEDLLASLRDEESAVLILTPEPRKIYLADDVIVAASLFNLTDVDAASIRVLLDGTDVTSRADVSTDLITYSPSALANGPHQVEIQASDMSGQPFTPKAWRFLVSSKASVTSERAYKQSGNIRSSTRRDNVDENILAVQSLHVNYRGGWDWLSIRGKMKLTSEEDAFKQPRNRFTATFETPWVSLGLGDVTPRINRFAMDGKRIRGYDLNLRLKLINLHMAKGTMERSIQGRNEDVYGKAADVGYIRAYEDTVGGALTMFPDVLELTRKKYTFRRDVTAIRPSLGSGRNFEWAFTWVKAKDQITSVDSIVYDGQIAITDSAFIADYFNDVGYDSALNARIATFRQVQEVALTNSGFDYRLPSDDWAGKSPQDNLVIGSDITMAMNKRRMVIQTGFAFSLLNKNIWDPVLTLDELDTFAPGDTSKDGKILGEMDLSTFPDPGDFEDYFHINVNQVPLVPIPIDSASLANPLYLVRNMPSLAFYLSLKLNYLRNFITVESQQVGPEFNSLANPNLQKNVRIKSLSDRVRLFRNKLFLTVAYRSTDDDIGKLENDPITSTTNLNVNANLNLGGGLPSFSIGQRTYTRDNGVVLIDTIAAASEVTRYVDQRENTLTSTTNISFNYRLALLNSNHDITLTIANSTITDEIQDRHPVDTLWTTPSNPIAISSILQLGVNSKISENLRTNVSMGTNQQEFGEGDNLLAQDLVNFDISARYRILDGRALVRAGMAIISSNTDRSVSATAPPSFSRQSLRGGFEMNMMDNLRFISSIEFRTKTVDGLDESVGSSIIAANLVYTF